MKVLVLGATGMLGSAVFKTLQADPCYEVWGTVRGPHDIDSYSSLENCQLVKNVDVLDQDTLISTLADIRPEVVINCIGLIKQLKSAFDPLSVLPINAMLPHRILKLCELTDSRVIQISTDCVFSGQQGMYTEASVPDAQDLYGQSKLIGELNGSLNAVTLRTSIIGHEMGSARSLVDWFLSQEGTVRGYSKAIFSGLPTVELATIIRDYVLPNKDLHGLYHVSAEPIDKCTLLNLIAKSYGKTVTISADSSVKIDRSLDSSNFRATTGYKPPQWDNLVELMRASR